MKEEGLDDVKTSRVNERKSLWAEPFPEISQLWMRDLFASPDQPLQWRIQRSTGTEDAGIRAVIVPTVETLSTYNSRVDETTQIFCCL